MPLSKREGPGLFLDTLLLGLSFSDCSWMDMVMACLLLYYSFRFWAAERTALMALIP